MAITLPPAELKSLNKTGAASECEMGAPKALVQSTFASFMQKATLSETTHEEATAYKNVKQAIKNNDPGALKTDYEKEVFEWSQPAVVDSIVKLYDQRAQIGKSKDPTKLVELLHALEQKGIIDTDEVGEKLADQVASLLRTNPVLAQAVITHIYKILREARHEEIKNLPNTVENWDQLPSYKQSMAYRSTGALLRQFDAVLRDKLDISGSDYEQLTDGPTLANRLSAENLQQMEAFLKEVDATGKEHGIYRTIGDGDYARITQQKQKNTLSPAEGTWAKHQAKGGCWQPTDAIKTQLAGTPLAPLLSSTPENPLTPEQATAAWVDALARIQDAKTPKEVTAIRKQMMQLFQYANSQQPVPRDPDVFRAFGTFALKSHSVAEATRVRLTRIDPHHDKVRVRIHADNLTLTYVEGSGYPPQSFSGPGPHDVELTPHQIAHLDEATTKTFFMADASSGDDDDFDFVAFTPFTDTRVELLPSQSAPGAPVGDAESAAKDKSSKLQKEQFITAFFNPYEGPVPPDGLPRPLSESGAVSAYRQNVAAFIANLNEKGVFSPALTLSDATSQPKLDETMSLKVRIRFPRDNGGAVRLTMKEGVESNSAWLQRVVKSGYSFPPGDSQFADLSLKDIKEVLTPETLKLFQLGVIEIELDESAYAEKSDAERAQIKSHFEAMHTLTSP